MLDKLSVINLQRMQGLQKGLKYISMRLRRPGVTFSQIALTMRTGPRLSMQISPR